MSSPLKAPPASISTLDESAGWYVLRLNGMRFEGPAKIDAIRNALETGKLSWTDYAYHPDFLQGWGRLCEVRALVKLFPKAPEASVLKSYEGLVKTKTESDLRWRAANPSGKSPSNWYLLLTERSKNIPREERLNEKYWYLLLDGREVGPVEMADVERALKAGPPPSSLFGWQKGMRNWIPADGIPALAKLIGVNHVDYPEDPSFVIERGNQRRKSSRRSLVASVHQISADGSSRMLGICGDLSAQGFQLIQYGVPEKYSQGTRLIMEIRASKTSDVIPFKLSAIVKWYDPERNLVGFEFETIDPVDHKLISKYTSKLG